MGRLVLPAASFYTFNKSAGLGPSLLIFGTGLFLPRRYLVIFLQSYFTSRSLMRELLEPYFSRVRFTAKQKRHWFHDREGLLFGFGVGFYIFLRIPLLGVLIYGIAEASTAYLITKITDPPPPPAQSEGFAESQERWSNKHEFLNLNLANLDALEGHVRNLVKENPMATGPAGGIVERKNDFTPTTTSSSYSSSSSREQGQSTTALPPPSAGGVVERKNNFTPSTGSNSNSSYSSSEEGQSPREVPPPPYR